MKSFIVGFIVRAIIFAAIVLAVLFLILPLPGNIPVLMYHFIDTPERAEVEKNVVSQESFRNQMDFLKKFGYRVISMDEYDEIKTGKRKPRGREVVITFDDGNYTYYDQAFPILKEFGYHSTNFVVSNNVREKIHGSMTRDQILELLNSELVTIGSHSKSHPLLSKLSDSQVRDELVLSKQELESMFSNEIRYLAYPSGDMSEQVVENAKRAGYRLAFTTTPAKLNELPKSLYTLTRIKVSRTSDMLFAFWFKLSGLYDGFKQLRTILAGEAAS